MNIVGITGPENLIRMSDRKLLKNTRHFVHVNARDKASDYSRKAAYQREYDDGQQKLYRPHRFWKTT